MSERSPDGGEPPAADGGGSPGVGGREPAPEPGTWAAAEAAAEADPDRRHPLLRDPRVVVARRELRSLASEKTIVLALTIQLFVAGFSSFLVVGLVSLYDPGGVSGFTVDAAVSGPAADDLLAAVDEVDGVTARPYPSREAALEEFQDGRVTAVLHTRRVGENGERIRVDATVPDNSVETTVVVAQLREAFSAFERGERVERSPSLSTTPLSPPPRAGGTPYFGFTYTVLVPLLLLLPAFIAGSVTVDSLTEEVDRGTLSLLRAAPTTLPAVVDGKLLAAVGLAPIQAALWLGLLAANGTPVRNPLALLALAGAFALAAGGLGAAIALSTPDRRAAQLLYSAGVLGLFGGTALLPGNPANTVARLAVGSVDATVLGALAGYVVVAVGAYALARRVVSRVDAEALG